jgi:hypothetical protein
VQRLDPLAAIVDRAEAFGVRPWALLKQALARKVVESVAAGGRAAVLQGGAALHFAYGSPRLSADVDFAGVGVALQLEQQGPGLADAAGAVLARTARWSLQRTGRLLRGKVTIEVDAARRLVLPVEAYEVPAHRPVDRGTLGSVEAADEIAADKLVASADRFVRRGTLKTTDLFDLWFVTTVVGAPRPDPALVGAKLADYGQAPSGVDLAAAMRATPREELRAALEGALPAEDLARIDAAAVIEVAADVAGGYRDVL